MTREPLLLIPGMASDGLVWRGMPDGEIMMSDAATIALMADEILACAPDRFALAGHSMGGYVALAIVTNAPARVTRLALLSSSAAPDDAAQSAARAAPLDDAAFGALAEKLAYAALHRDQRAGSLPGELAAMTRRVGAATLARQQAATAARADMRPMLPAITAPCLILAGDSDRIVAPARSGELAAAIAGAHLVMLAGCGHMPQLEKPDETRAALEAWLAR